MSTEVQELSSPSMTDLPKETIFYILSKLDGVTLIAASRSCSLFRSVVKDLQVHFSIWLVCCLRELSDETLIHLTGFIEFIVEESARSFLQHCKELPWQFWKEIYVENYRSSYVKIGQRQLLELCMGMFHGSPTSMIMRDNVIITGHKNGSVFMWENIDDNLMFTKLHQHKSTVTDIALLSSVLSPEHLTESAKFRKGLVAVSASKDTKIMVRNINSEDSITLNFSSKQVNCVDYWGLNFTAASQASVLHGQPVWKFEDPLLPVVPKESFSLSGNEGSTVTAVGYWNDKIYSGDQSGQLFCWDLNQINNGKSPEPKVIADFNSYIKQMIVYGGIIICLTDNGKLHTCSKDGKFTSHSIHKTMFRKPECIALRGSLFAIGLKGGMISVYHMVSLDFWNPFNVENYTECIKTGHGHVNGIAIGDDGAGPVLVVRNETSTLLIYRWRMKKLQE